MPQHDPSKTEKATPRRRNKQRTDGHVPKAPEMGRTMVLLAGLLAMRYMIDFYRTQFMDIYQWFFREGMRTELTQESVYSLFLWVMGKIAILILPFMCIIVAASALTMRLQVGHLWNLKLFRPGTFSRMFNIAAGIKALMISPQALVRLGRSLAQALVVGIAPYVVIKQEFPNLIPLFYQNAQGLAGYILSVGYKMTSYALVPMILIAVADLWYTRWNYEEEIKMSKDEVKDEQKQAEGDPVIRSAQKQKMFATMAKRMLKEVPTADVVVTNPTHIAVALRYNVMQDPAPLVVAKGLDHLAERIKEIAREHNVPIREDKPLAQALYKQVEIGEIIPEELYQAVAAILAKLDKFKAGRR